MIKEQDKDLTPQQLAAVQATRQKKGLALATGNPLDQIVISPPENEKKPVQSEETLVERVVSMMQRRKRALQMRRSKSKITRVRNVKRTRLATKEQLLNRARRMAKTMLRKRAAGARGASYSKLSPAQKMNIDRQIEPRTKNIGAMAAKLLPRVRAGEMRRLSAVRTHKSTKGVYGNLKTINQSFEPVLYSKLLGEKISNEDLNAMFSMYEGKILSAVTAPIRVAAKTVAAGAIAAHALSSPQNTAAAAGGLAAYSLKKLSSLGKTDPDKEKKDKTDKHTDNMNQQALIQSKEKTKQAQLTTKRMQQKSSNNNIVAHKEWDYESYLQEKSGQHLQKKADKYGVSLEEVTSVFEQGLSDYVQNDRNTHHQFAINRVNSYLAKLFEGGLWDNIHAKRNRIKHGSGERMRKPGSKGAPTKQNFVDASEGIGAGFEGTKKLTDKYKKVTP